MMHHICRWKMFSTRMKIMLLIFVTFTIAFSSLQVAVGSSQSADNNGVDDSGVTLLLSEANNRFAFDLYGALSQDDPGANMFFSPFSISTALSMTLLGARGHTREQMMEVLRFDESLSDNKAHQGFKSLLKRLVSTEKDLYEVHLANRVYVQEGIQMLDSFHQDTTDFYGAESHNINFQMATESARQTINSWVEEITRDKIQDLLKPGVLSEDTRFVLVNAVYFKGTWQRQFDPKLTHQRKFYTDNSRITDVAMMHKEGHFRNGYSEELNAQILELPYDGDKLSMMVILPRERDGLGDLERKLTAKRDVLSELSGQLKNTSIDVYLPKFNMTCEFNLAETLIGLGMRDVFADNADLSGLTGGHELKLSHVVHKAFIEVNEEGTEAAAATAAVVALRAMHKNMFRADHPFYYAIRHEKTNSVLFIGRVFQPEGTPVSNQRVDL